MFGQQNQSQNQQLAGQNVVTITKDVDAFLTLLLKSLDNHSENLINILLPQAPIVWNGTPFAGRDIFLATYQNMPRPTTHDLADFDCHALAGGVMVTASGKVKVGSERGKNLFGWSLSALIRKENGQSYQIVTCTYRYFRSEPRVQEFGFYIIRASMIEAILTPSGINVQQDPSQGLFKPTEGLLFSCFPSSLKQNSSSSPLISSDISGTGGIGFYDILWAEPSSVNIPTPSVTDPRGHYISLSYAGHISSSVVKPHTEDCLLLALSLDQWSEWPTAQSLCEYILKQAYPMGCQLSKRLMVIVNPHGGKGHAIRTYRSEGAPLFKAARCLVDVITTEYAGHARDIGREKVSQGKYDAIVCASGDGIPHEILNGMWDYEDEDGKKRSKRATELLANTAICQLPCGSGNALAKSLNGTASPSESALAIIKGYRLKSDLMVVSQKTKGSYLTFLTQTHGLIAESDLGTEHLRWMGGARFSFGVVQRLLFSKTYPCRLDVKYQASSKSEVRRHFAQYMDNIENNTTPAEKFTPRFGTVEDELPSDWTSHNLPNASMIYVSKLPWVSTENQFFPAALPHDGAMDLCYSNTMSPFHSIPIMVATETGAHLDSPGIEYAKIEAYRLTPAEEDGHGYLSMDGESYPFEPFQVEVWPRAATFLSKTGRFVDTGL
ncbi:hypothetical protein NADFUDRAFT_39124 [Nadsonia fulvescens var. elongata DSM 6958]|uniref:DAGKc domain-containing protein n=1 Tax=Nadsonia fulvescens var. elongata DSM 6958 TaxID=857566 RepID=A0A1E3PQI3_9ASCO|nr:hypothetical protein NADFUDRAFT_39124 [Nadsonia fulvescens var. elongata DSM 6958]